MVLITGSSGDLGRELAEQFARRGARLVLWDSESQKQDETKALIVANVKGARIDNYVVDLLDSDKVQSTAETVKTDIGSVDLVIHAAETSMQEKGCPG